MQENAIRSWANLGLNILIIGDDAGTCAIAHLVGARHVSNVARSPEGTPLLNDLFHRAKANSHADLLCYLNSDIILRQDFVDTLEALLEAHHHLQPALVTARRQNIPLNVPLSSQRDPEAFLRERVTKFACWDQANAADLFLFHRSLFSEIPTLAIGRMQWDNWLLWRARQDGANVIDASGSITALHPVHGYASNTLGWKQVTQGRDAQRNRHLCAGNLLDIAQAATHYFFHGEMHAEAPADGFQQDLFKFTAGALYQLIDGFACRPVAETIDCLRALLWRNRLYFPLNFDRTTLSAKELSDGLTQAQEHLASHSLDACLQCLQSLLTRAVLDQTRQITRQGRRVVIWGCGELGKRVQSLLEQEEIPFDGFMDSDPTKANQVINGKRVLSTEQLAPTGNKTSAPFIIIASMYYSDMVQKLVESGLQAGRDFIA